MEDDYDMIECKLCGCKVRTMFITENCPGCKVKEGCLKFVKHVEAWEEKGIPYGWNDLVMSANKYGTPVPKTKQWKKIFGEEKNGKKKT